MPLSKLQRSAVDRVDRDLERGVWGSQVKDTKGLLSELLRAGGVDPDTVPLRKNVGGSAFADAGPHYNRGFPRLQRLYERLLKKDFDLASQLGREPFKRYIHVPEGKFNLPHVVAHEAGHAVTKGPFARAISRLSLATSIPVVTSALPYGLLIGGTLGADRDATEMNVAQKAALPAAVIPVIANQAEEFRAHLLGRKLMRQTGRTLPNFWRAAVGAQSTHLWHQLRGLAIPTAGALALHRHYKKKRDASSTADDLFASTQVS
jgi:hypothetical protein